ncbi:hypothetical protein PSENEW3_00004452 [Picochlorum sp. SENEW3]|nr:hypothetical protein PSENEW3_00004452 [Picochlorum sp. SENEW3]
MDAAEIDALTYNDVRRACKDVGIPAKGKLVDLREALKAHYGSTESVPSRGEEPSSGRRKTTAASAVSMDTAIHTPLPERASRRRSSTSEAGSYKVDSTKTKKKKKAARRTHLWIRVCGAMMSLVLSAGIVTVMPYCQEHRCGDAVKAFVVDQVHGVGTFVEHVSSGQVIDAVRQKSAWVLDMAKVQVSRAKDGVMKKVDNLQSFLEEKKATQQTGKERSVEVLNRAVLNAVLGLDEKSPDWGSIVSSLDDVWSFRKISRNKANVAMFVCTDATSCRTTEDELAAVAPPSMVMKLDVTGQVDTMERGEVQHRLATFLKESPRGVVVVPRIDQWSTLLISVLNNAMGEGGSLMQDGEQVPTHDATYMLTVQIPKNIVQGADSAAKLSTDVKTHLQSTLVGRLAQDDVSHSIANAFRRRVDVVAPSKSSSL